MLIVALIVILIYYRYVILPMRKKHLAEEESLKLQQAELMALFASLSPDPIFRFDESGIIILANNSAHKTFPYKLLVGEHVNNILPFTKDYNLADLINGASTTLNTCLIEKSFYQFMIVGVPKFKICQAYGRDITDLKKTENELKSALIKADESKKLKEYFLAQISHEIRSPLNVIVGYSDLLNEELKVSDSEGVVQILRSIKNNSKRLYRTFDLLLNMSQIQTGKYEIRLEKVDISALLRTLYFEFQNFAEEKGLKLLYNNLLNDSILLSCDHYSISQVFVNLIDNAIKYTNEGTIEIRFYEEDNNYCVDILDTGKGMSKEFIDKLFTPFTQEEMGYSRRYEGTGLGLAIVKSFVELNKASIKVTSQPDVGSKFTIILNGEERWGTPHKKNLEY